MNGLIHAVDIISQWPTERQAERAQVADELEGLANDCASAASLWSEYLRAPGAPGDQWTIISWIGAGRAKRLHEIGLTAEERVRGIVHVAGLPGLLEDDVIEMAYRKLRPGETGPNAAKAAIDRMNEQSAHMRTLAARVRAATSKPKPQDEPLKKSGTRAQPVPGPGTVH